LEENYLFPRLLKAGKETQLVNTLLAQHQAGRRLTDNLLQISTRQMLLDSQTRQSISQMLIQYCRMYRPHASREDTILFPAFKDIVLEREYKELGEQFEGKEHQLFGEGGFNSIVEEVTDLEKQLGIYDLAQFTPAL
jgi:hemerythrin-like domain-containing protein